MTGPARIVVCLVAGVIVAACSGGSTGEAQAAGGGSGAGEQGVVGAAPTPSGAVLEVPGQYATIAAALAAANPGDTVRVAAGTYPECPVLKDGVALVGPEVPPDGLPVAILDGQGSCTAVVRADASVTRGATLRNFSIENSAARGIVLEGARGVVLSRVRVHEMRGIGILSSRATFTIDHSRVVASQGGGGVVLDASEGTIVDTRVAGGAGHGVVVRGALYLEDPGFAPSRAQLVRNQIVGNGRAGLLVEDKGSSVRAEGNLYDRNGWGGVLALGGGEYRGQGETLTNARGAYGVNVQGCDLRCVNQDCSERRVLLDRSSATIRNSTISGNPMTGVNATCGGDVEIDHSTLSGNGTGLQASATLYLSTTVTASLPSTVTARDSSFTGNANAGAWLLEVGTTGKGERNRFTGNLDGLHVSGGASWEGKGESFSGNSAGQGAIALGCELLCANFDCSLQVLVQETSRMRLDGPVLSDNGQQGAAGLCGAEVELVGALVSGNMNGAVLQATVDFGGGRVASAPSTLTARGSVFTGNRLWGVIGYGSQLALGTVEDPGGNSFLSNGDGAIANLFGPPGTAQQNWFGTADAGVIAGLVQGDVTWQPFLLRPPHGP